MKTFFLNGRNLTINEISKIISSDATVKLAPDCRKLLRKNRQTVNHIAKSKKIIYGINTGFGALSQRVIDSEDVATLQLHLIRSHACGVGSETPIEIIKLCLLLRAHSLCQNHDGISSGISPELIDSLLFLYNHQIYPSVPCQGSVGASGDLAPLAHIALAVIGEGECYYRGTLQPTSLIYKKLKHRPHILGAKEGLALINGTTYSLAIGITEWIKAAHLCDHADICAALSNEAMRGSIRAYSPRLAGAKAHPGLLQTVNNLQHLLTQKNKKSSIQLSHLNCNRVQDSYSLRCVPQVHGAARQALGHAKDVLTQEINSLTDNPLFDEHSNEFISGGHFHAQAIAIATDYLAIGVAELASIAERRIEKLTNTHFSELPPFLIKESGINSGLMIPQVVAASLVSENKILCHPASVDSIPTSTDKEDHVSMAPISARKLAQVNQNTLMVLAIELLANTQALDLLAPLKTTDRLQKVKNHIRKSVKTIDKDRAFYLDIKNIAAIISSQKLIEIAGFKHFGK